MKNYLRKEKLKIEISGNDANTDQISEDLEKVFNDISALCGEKNKDIANEYLSQMNDPIEGVNMAKNWNLKKRLAPKNTADPPMAKKDASGNLVTEKTKLENLYLETYVKRLQPNKIAEGLESLEEMKEFLYKLRYKLCQGRKSKDWGIDDLEKVLKGLKDNKARDYHGHTYELFKFCGKDLKMSIQKLFNLVKNKQIYPKIFQAANITSLYKQKGEKSYLNSDLGI